MFTICFDRRNGYRSIRPYVTPTHFAYATFIVSATVDLRDELSWNTRYLDVRITAHFNTSVNKTDDANENIGNWTIVHDVLMWY